MAAPDMFLKLEGVTGECAASGHTTEMALTGWEWGFANNTSFYGSGGGTISKGFAYNIRVSQQMDKSAPTLVQFCMSGEHIQEGTIVMRKSGGKTPLDYLTLTFKECVIAYVNMKSGGEVPEMVYDLAFKEYTISYQPQDDKGAKSGGPIDTTYNVATASAGA